MECGASEQGAAAAVTLLQARYTLPILQALLSGPQRFNALQRHVNAPSAATLRTRLADLTRAGAVQRTGDLYQPTAAGQALEPVFQALHTFTQAHPDHHPDDLLQLLQKRHALAVMRALRGQSLGFNDLQRTAGLPSATTVTRRLHDLEAAGLLTRTVPPSDPPRPQYSHSAVGAAFSPVIGAMLDWGARHLLPGRS